MASRPNLSRMPSMAFSSFSSLSRRGRRGGEQIELLACLALLHQGLGGEGEGAHGGVLPPGGADEFHSRLGQLTGHIGGGAQPFLAADVLEIGVADGHLEGGALEAVARRRTATSSASSVTPGVELRPSHQIAGKGESVAHRFGARLLRAGTTGECSAPVA